MRISDWSSDVCSSDLLMLVLQLLATVCRTPLSARLNEVLRWLRENPARDTRDWAVFRVNDAVRDHRELRGRTLREAIEAEAGPGGDEWRVFEFRHIVSILRDDGTRSEEHTSELQSLMPQS